LKPTVGLTSRVGLIPLNPKQDSAGPITRWVKDSARILQLISGLSALLAKRGFGVLICNKVRMNWT